MKKRTRSVDELIKDLESGTPEPQVQACAALREMGAAATAAVPMLVGLLDDDGVARWEFPPDYGGDSSETFGHVAKEAILTLGRIAPDAAPEAVAAAIVRLVGRVDRIERSPVSVDTHRLGFERQTLEAFGPPLVAALHRIAAAGSSEEREKAATVLATLAGSHGG